MELKAINAGIKRVAASYGKINAFVQTIAVACIAHAQAHGDCTPALRLVQAMPKSARRGLLINWFGQYSPIGMNVNTGKVGLHRPDAKAYNAFNLDGAKANNWYEGAEADKENLPDTTVEDVRKGLLSLASRFQKRLDDGTVAANDRDAVTRNVLAIKELAKVA